jgi:elongation factor G
MDRVGADFEMSVRSIRERLGANRIPVQIPLGTEEKFVGVIDLISMRALVWAGKDRGEAFEAVPIPSEVIDEAAAARERMIEKAAELDDALTEKFLSGSEIPIGDVVRALRKGCLDLKATPVFCGSAFKNRGVQTLLDGVVAYLPSPLDLPSIEGHNPIKPDLKVVCPTDFTKPAAALAFKISSDPFAGSLTYVRVYSGQIKVGETLLNPRLEKKERVQRLVRMHANQREEIQVLKAGDIGAIVGLKITGTGDTLCDNSRPVLLESILTPIPVISMAIEARTAADQPKLMESLERLKLEDPSCSVRVDAETGQTLIYGMGELHLEILVDRLLREFKVQANVGRPQVNYRETISNQAEAEVEFEREIAGKINHGHVHLIVEPAPRGSGLLVDCKFDPKLLPQEMARAIEAGVSDARFNGPLAGFEVVDVRVRVGAARYRQDQSTTVGYKIAATNALRTALAKAYPKLLEPIVRIEVAVPDEFLGNVIGDLNSRRGRVEGVSPRGVSQIVRGEAPLSTMFGYATDLRSMSQGRASFSMDFKQYDVLPERAEQEVLTAMGRVSRS